MGLCMSNNTRITGIIILAALQNDRIPTSNTTCLPSSEQARFIEASRSRNRDLVHPVAMLGRYVYNIS